MIKLYLSIPQWQMLGYAWNSYSYDFWDNIEAGGDKREIKTWEVLNRKLSGVEVSNVD